MDAYAIIETGGKQYMVRKGSLVDTETVAGEAGAKVKFDRVLAVSDGKELTIGQPALAGATVSASIVKQYRGAKVINFKKKRRKGYRRKIGHRQELTRVKVEAIA
jgi:large subunit ribosomal protein L21